MAKTDIHEKSVKFSQLMLAINEMDERLESLEDALSKRFEEVSVYVRASLERMIVAIQRLEDVPAAPAQTSSKKKADSEDKWMTTAEVAKYIRRSVYRVRVDIKNGLYGGIPVNGRYRIKKSDVDRYMESLQNLIP